MFIALDEAGELDRLADRPAAIRVDRDDKIGAAAIATGGDAGRVRLGREAPDLDLAAGHPGFAQPGHLAPEIGQRLAVLVIGGDRDDRQPLGKPAEEGGDRRAERFAQEVPQRGVDAGDRFHHLLAVAVWYGELEHLGPQPFDMSGVLAEQQRRQLVRDDSRDVAAVRPVVAVVDLARQPVRGADAGDDRVAAGHPVAAAAEHLPQRDLYRDGLDAVDFHGALRRIERRIIGQPRGPAYGFCGRSPAAACAAAGLPAGSRRL